MEVLHFDARFIRLDHHDGISRFSVELLNALHKRVRVVAIVHDLRQLEYLPQGLEFVLVNSPQSPQEILIAWKLNKVGATHVFSPMQVMGTVGRKYKLVLTLHDLIYYRHRKPPQDLNLAVKIIWRLYHLSYAPQRMLLDRADAIATVSRTTQQLVSKHHLTKRPTTVVYNSARSNSSSSIRTMPTNKNLLYIGSFMPYKNVETLVRAMAFLPDFQLHLLSKIDSKLRKNLEALTVSSGGKVFFHEGVSDSEYFALLRDAFALVSASLDEGFGIPLVEAMRQGTPVVVSDLEIFHEVAGKAGKFFSARSPQQFAEQVLDLAKESNWTSASAQAQVQAKTFDWDDSADQLLKLFAQL